MTSGYKWCGRVWQGVARPQELDALKRQGNEAFKAGKADLAFVHYNQAQVPRDM